jgi:ketosteroid isomerase-like protein
MKKVVFTLAVMIVAAISISAQSAKQEDAIRQVMADQVDAWNRGDLEGFMHGYWRSEKLTFISGDKVTRGWQRTLDNYKKTYDSRAKMGTLMFSDIEFVSISKSRAIVKGSWALKRIKDTPKGRFTLTFRKFKEGWRIVRDHTT